MVVVRVAGRLDARVQQRGRPPAELGDGRVFSAADLPAAAFRRSLDGNVLVTFSASSTRSPRCSHPGAGSIVKRHRASGARVADTHSLGDAALAHKGLEAGGVRGRLVLVTGADG